LNRNNIFFQNIETSTVINKGTRIQIAPKESTTHRRIKQLRGKFNHHTYIGYTATPWPSFLIPTINNLSPDFHQLVEPGSNYRGADYFFDQRGDHQHIDQIPSREVGSLYVEGIIPPSLKTAITFFLVGVAKFIYEKRHLRESGDSISMMISPGEQTGASADNDDFMTHEYISEIVREYINDIKQRLYDKSSPEFESEIKHIKKVYDDLKLTERKEEGYLPKFDNEFIKNFHKALAFTEVIEFNARSTQSIPEVNWNIEGFSRILIGGVGLSRGYTVEGITTTYMPRNMSPQESTTFQRSRFFGYHNNYLSLMRIWLPMESINGYEFLREREMHTWNLLRLTEDHNLPLKEMPRMILRDPNNFFEPARRSIMGFQRLQVGSPLQTLHDSNSFKLNDSQLNIRYKLYSDLKHKAFKTIKDISVRENFNHQKHKVIDDLKISQILALLEPLDFDRSQDLNWRSVFYSMNRYINDHEDAILPIIIMNNRNENGDKMTRGILSGERIQIRSNRGGKVPEDYDQNVQYEYLRGNNSELPERIPTLQIYNFDIRRSKDPNSEIIKRNVTFFYLYTPRIFLENYNHDIYVETNS
jgi:hypothetical protein